MTLEQVSGWRTWVGRVAALLCLFFMVAALDGLVSRFRQPPNEYNLLAGEKIKINGTLSTDVQLVEQLTYTSSPEGVKVSFEALHAGFWLGGRMWRGELSVGEALGPGEYKVFIVSKGDEVKKPHDAFLIKVFADRKALLKSSKSLIERYLEISPWWAFVYCLLLSALSICAVFGLSHKRDQLLAEVGMAEIYRINPGESGCEVGFGLGTQHGVSKGSRLELLDETMQPLGFVEVLDAHRVDSVGIAARDLMIRPGFIVRRL